MSPIIVSLCKYATERCDSAHHEERSAEELKLAVFCATWAYIQMKESGKHDAAGKKKKATKSQGTFEILSDSANHIAPAISSNHDFMALPCRQ